MRSKYIFSVGSNIWKGISFVFFLALVALGVTFASDAATDSCFCWSSWPLLVISDSGRYFVIRFFVRPGHVDKYPSFIACSRVIFWCSRGSDDKIWLSLVGMLGDIPWGSVVSLVWCFYTSFCLSCLISCWIVGCIGMYHRAGSSIIRSLDTNSLQYYLNFF